MDSFPDISSSFLGDANATAPLYEFLAKIPGLGWLQGYLSQWLKLDITAIAATVTILGTLSGVLQFLHALTVKAYWWITRFFTASVSISARDKLNKEVLNWVGARVLTRQGTRIVTARSEEVESDAFYYRRTTQTRVDYDLETRKPIQYLPTFGSTWFIHDRNIFIVRRVSIGRSSNMQFLNNVPTEFSSAPEGGEPLVVLCLGRSVEPIKRFLDHCRDFAEKQRAAYVTVRVSKSRYSDESWETSILRPIRPLESIHFDEKTKQELVADVKTYLDPATRKFYNQRGIPYRRGYLLHGPAGTGKTSLSLALAGLFGLELYLLHIPSVREDLELERLFTALPPRCFVLLEDIDAVGIRDRGKFRNGHDSNSDDSEPGSDDEEDYRYAKQCRITLAGLLNVLDGVASQEGRIVLMTSNFAERLDRALVRPGRIDRKIFLGNMSQRCAELMFNRMYEHDPFTAADQKVDDDQLQQLALAFSSNFHDSTFTPAQLQGYLLHHRSDPRGAVDGLGAWMSEEREMAAETKRRAKEAAQARRRRRHKLLALKTNSHVSESGTVAVSRLMVAPIPASGPPTPPASARPARERDHTGGPPTPPASAKPGPEEDQTDDNSAGAATQPQPGAGGEQAKNNKLETGDEHMPR